MSRRAGRHDPFDGFEDVEPIGRGAFAQVHRAVDALTGQPVALKILEVEPSKRLDTATFQLEARALGSVNGHPNIVTLHRAILQPGRPPTLVMELCRGSYADRIAQVGPLPVREVVAVAVKLCGALETAHRAGILHRDLKPQNLLISRYDEPALADFGVAALRDAAAGSGSPLSGLTLLHAAPEVLLGHPSSPASEVYGLVSTLYELLVGHAPFFVTDDEDPAVVQRRILNDRPPSLRAPGVGRGLLELVTASLDKDPANRPASAVELARGLRAVELECGWTPTPCRIADEGDLEEPSAPPTPPPPAPSRAAATTGVPDLNLGVAPLGAGGPDEGLDRGLEPLGPRPNGLLPSRPAAPEDDLHAVASNAPAPEPAAAEEEPATAENGWAADADGDPAGPSRPPPMSDPAPAAPSEATTGTATAGEEAVAPLWGYDRPVSLHETIGLSGSEGRKPSAGEDAGDEESRGRLWRRRRR